MRVYFSSEEVKNILEKEFIYQEEIFTEEQIKYFYELSYLFCKTFCIDEKEIQICVKYLMKVN